jgi:hypothetical protein
MGILYRFGNAAHRSQKKQAVLRSHPYMGTDYETVCLEIEYGATQSYAPYHGVTDVMRLTCVASAGSGENTVL